MLQLEKRIMPNVMSVKGAFPANIWDKCVISAEMQHDKVLDNPTYNVIITLTRYRTQDSDAETKPSTSQTTGLAPASLSQPASGTGPRRTVSEQRFLRRRRFGPGQVRDAPARSKGRAHREQGVRRLWILPSVLLPSSVSLSARGPARVGASQTWPQTRPQTHAAGGRVDSGKTPARSFSASAGPGQRHPGEVWNRRPPSQY